MALYPESILVRLPAGMVGRIEDVCGNKQAFIREAIEVALGGGVVSSEVEVSPSASLSGSDADKVVGALGVGPLTERELSEKLDWPVGRVGKGVRDAGSRVRFLGGGLVGLV